VSPRHHALAVDAENGGGPAKQRQRCEQAPAALHHGRHPEDFIAPHQREQVPGGLAVEQAAALTVIVEVAVAVEIAQLQQSTAERLLWIAGARDGHQQRAVRRASASLQGLRHGFLPDHSTAWCRRAPDRVKAGSGSALLILNRRRAR
jgi:hypothetical protein